MRHFGRDDRDEAQALVLGAQADHLGDRGDAGPDVERPVEQLHLAGLDLGDIEHVADHGQQVFAALLDRVDGGGLLLAGQVALLQQFGIAQYGVQRRAQFVAHIGQELRLGGGGGLGGGAGGGQGLAFLVLHLAVLFVAAAHQQEAVDQEGAGGDQPHTQDDQVPLLGRQVGALEFDALHLDVERAGRRAAARIDDDGLDIVELRPGFVQGEIIVADPPAFGEQLVLLQVDFVDAIDDVELRGHGQDVFLGPALEIGRNVVLDQQFQVVAGAVIDQPDGDVRIVRKVEPLAGLGAVELQAVAAIGIGEPRRQGATPRHRLGRIDADGRFSAAFRVGIGVGQILARARRQDQLLAGDGVFAEHGGEGEDDQQEDGGFDLQIDIAEPAARRLRRFRAGGLGGGEVERCQGNGDEPLAG